MCRVLALLFAIVLPLKALAAVVVPIVGAPNHAHEAHGHEHGVAGGGAHADDPAHPACAGMSEQASTDAGTLHDHACPHLAMASVLPALPSLELDGRLASAPAAAAPPFVSVVLDLPVPPPTRRS